MLVLMVVICVGISSGLRADENERRGAVERRLELSERYLNSSPAAQITAGKNEEAKRFLTKAREHHDNAREALSDGDFDRAAELADQSIRAYAAATSAQRGGAKSQDKQSEENRALRAEIDAYLQAFRAALKEKGPTMAGLLNQQEIDQLLARAKQTENAGDVLSSNRTLRKAQQLVVTALTKIRSNETVVYSLEFRSPADEYRYERERYDEYLRLARQVLNSAQIADTKAAMFHQVLARGEDLNSQAQAHAGKGNFKDAVSSMEQALAKLVQGLQLLGVPVSR